MIPLSPGQELTDFPTISPDGQTVAYPARTSSGDSRPFLRKLAAHVQLAAAARRASMAEHLRDELREHYRLKEAGVLATEIYDACKVRILARH